MVSNKKFCVFIFAVVLCLFSCGVIAQPVCASDISGRITEDLHGADLNKDFKGIEYTQEIGAAMGGAIYNTGTIGNITGEFTENSAFAPNSAAFGGAVYNTGTIGNIEGTFTKNHVVSTNSVVFGGALHNSGSVGNIIGDFVQNYITDASSVAYGGAVYNVGSIGNITGNFIENYVESKSQAYGAAIYNSGTIGDIKGSFEKNHSISEESFIDGAAIYNQSGAVIGNIEGNFNDNYGEAYQNSRGGVVYNAGEIGDIKGDFSRNHLNVERDNSYGGAIYNDGKIGDITGNFIDNYVKSEQKQGIGGAIYNNGEMGNIEGNFVRNYSEASTNIGAGGAIYNMRQIGNILGSFIENKAVSETYYAQGGAITNYSTIGNITGSFIDNKSASESFYAEGGAIYNGSKIGNIEGDFSGNRAEASDKNFAQGGAISNGGEIGNINGSFLNNSIKGSMAQGGAIYNTSKMGDIEGSFYGNHAEGLKVFAFGGAISNSSQMSSITGDFVNNYVNSLTNFSAGGALYNAGTLGDIEGNFVGNHAESASWTYGGAIYNMGTIGTVEGSFVNNYVKSNSPDNLALGGAVYTNKDMTFSADNTDIVFSGNYTEDYRGKTPNAIFVDTYSPVELTLNAKNNGTIIFDDQIEGGQDAIHTIDHKNSYTLNLTGDKTGRIVLNNSVINAKVDVKEINLHLGKNDVFAESDFTMHSGSLILVNGIAEQQVMQSANITGDINMSVDVDLAGQKMDTLAPGTVVDPSAKISVEYLNLLNDANRTETNIFFAPEDYASQVAYTGASPIAYSPVWKYDVNYMPQNGSFKFTRSDYNPAVLPTPVAQQAGAYTTQTQTFNYAFQHSDNFMAVPYLERVAIKNANRYAFSPTGDATDVGTFSPLLTKHVHNGFWVKPYASFENIPLKNGPKVSNINYGTLVGYDSDIKELRRGFDRVLTGYIGYNGASQRYGGVDTYQNGGIVGTTATLYKGNFFNATTVSVGASSGNSTTMYGSENYAMLLAGIGNKTGYNFEFKEGRIILQPSFLISYTFVNTFDYTNAAGLKIKSDPLNAIQLAPGIKLIGNTKSGWQPYIGVNMIWNLMDKSKVTAGDVRLPEMSIKPYVQYGVGVQKCFKEDKITAYGQAMVNSGGRNGVALSMGLRWRVGK